MGISIFSLHHKDDITPFKQLLLDLAKDHLILKAKTKYLLTDFEAEYLWELSRDTKEKELTQLTDNIVNFEKMVLEQGDLEKEKLDALAALLDKEKEQAGLTAPAPAPAPAPDQSTASATVDSQGAPQQQEQMLRATMRRHLRRWRSRLQHDP